MNAQRSNLNKGEPNLVFVVDGPGSYEYIDAKNPIDPRKFLSAKKSLKVLIKWPKELLKRLQSKKVVPIKFCTLSILNKYHMKEKKR